MGVFYTLRNLFEFFWELRGVFIDIGANINNVPIVGKALSTWFFILGYRVTNIAHVINDLAFDWLAFYNWISDNITVDNVLNQLLRYADDLISFIRYPFEFIGDVIRDHFPELHQIARDPVEWVLETIYRYTGLSYSFVHGPIQFIERLIRDAIGELEEIARNPRAWLLDRLDDFIPDFRLLISNSARWVRDRVEDAFPELSEFLRDPRDFIEREFIELLELLSDRYLTRVVKLSERILSKIF